MISSPGSNGVYNGKLAFVPGLEDVLVWDIKKAQLVRRIYLGADEHSSLADGTGVDVA